jgi:hypothetical protein
MTRGCRTIWCVIVSKCFHSIRDSSHQVLAAQTRLAQQLSRRPNLYEVYLTELLTLFVDKGVAVQNVAVSAQSAKVCSNFLVGLLTDAYGLDGGND